MPTLDGAVTSCRKLLGTRAYRCPAKTEAAMRNTVRGALALSVLVWSIAAPSPSRLAGARRAAAQPACNQPCDAEQVAAVRSMADEECDCASATQHDAYVDCVSKGANAGIKHGS